MPEAETNSRPVIVVVDDDDDVRRLLEFNLASAGFRVTGLDRAIGVDAIARELDAVVIILDRMLPDADGVEVCRTLRGSTGLSHVGLLLLTARGTEEDRLDGFHAGADDYVVKPFSVREIIARVRVLASATQVRQAALRTSST